MTYYETRASTERRRERERERERLHGVRMSLILEARVLVVVGKTSVADFGVA
jgi:hypothetical protein